MSIAKPFGIIGRKKKTDSSSSASVSSSTGAANVLGGYTDTALAERRNRNTQATNIIADRSNDLNNDPLWNSLRTTALRNAQNPGISSDLLQSLRGRIAARSAASAGAGARQLVQQYARGNLSGNAAVNALQLANNRAAINRENQNLDLDEYAENARRQDKASSLSQLSSLLTTDQSMKNSLAGLQAQTVNSYDPLYDLGRVQQLMQPAGNLGYAEGLSSGGSGDSAALKKLLALIAG